MGPLVSFVLAPSGVNVFFFPSFVKVFNEILYINETQ